MSDFSGWEKLSLVDYDDNITTTLFMAGCPFRCPFCHNAELVLHPESAPKIPWAEIKGYLEKRQGVLDAVCISGGEPTLLPDLEDKCREIKELGYKVKLDSNGCQPHVLSSLIEKKLVDYIAMDIKNSKERYMSTCGTKIDMTAIEESVDLLIHSGIPFEFRTTVMEEFHDEEAFEKIADWVRGAKRFYVQRYVDSGGCIQNGFHQVPIEKARKFVEILAKTVDFASLRGYDE